ncbi:MAG: HD-GYP domain-containing protein [Sulfurifustaceae bacterium]
MKKKIGVQHLRLGMYVSELDRPWIESRFLFQGFEIRTDDELAELRRLCKYVYIETEVEYRDGALRPRQPSTFGTPDPEEFAAKRIGFEILDQFETPQAGTPRYPDQTALEAELPAARELVATTDGFVQNLLHDLRLGRSLDADAAKELVAAMVQSILRNPDAAIWFTRLKQKDEYESQHSLRTCVLALAFGRHLELPEETLNHLGLGVLLHDVGKTRVPAELLRKTGPLTDGELELMKSHVPRGVEILEQTPGIPPESMEVARWHHERFDGSGYAEGLKGEEISLFGQIGAIVDTYDDITSDSAYKKSMSPHDALRKLYEWRRKDFHEKLVEQFIQCIGIYPIGSVVQMNTGSIGVVIAANRQRRLRPRVALVLDPDQRPYPSPKTIDLYDEERRGDSTLSIRTVLPAGSFGIDPSDYLPLDKK